MVLYIISLQKNSISY